MSSFQQQGSARAPPPCAAGCGFFGSPSTLDMCSVCYKKHCHVNGAEPGADSAAASRSAVAAAVIGTTASSTAAKSVAGVSFAPAAKAMADGVAAAAAAVPSSSAPATAKKAQPIRCVACYKKVGLTGFVCRCSKTFCGRHRYAEEHGCSFDFKGVGRDAIARNNPLVKGDKLAGKI